MTVHIRNLIFIAIIASLSIGCDIEKLRGDLGETSEQPTSIEFTLKPANEDLYFSQYNTMTLLPSTGVQIEDLSLSISNASLGTVSASGVFTPAVGTHNFGALEINATHSSGSTFSLELFSLGQPYVWLNADEFKESATDGEAQTLWVNKSGQPSGRNLNFASQGAGQEPKYKAPEASLNNHPYMTFDVDDCFGTVDNYPQLDGFEVFVVLRDTASNQGFEVAFGFGRDEGFGVRRNGSTENDWGLNLNAAFGASDHALISGIGYDENNWFVFHGRRDSATDLRQASINGTALLTDVSGSSALTAEDTLYAGCDQDGRDFDGDIAEVILFNENITSAHRSFIINYLLSKYNISP